MSARDQTTASRGGTYARESRRASIFLITQTGDFNMTTTEMDFLVDLDRAREAAARGDYRDAERWTGLAERKFSIVRRVCEVAFKAGWKPDLLEFLQAGQTGAPAPAPALPKE
jgi:hypothetical protein